MAGGKRKRKRAITMKTDIIKHNEDCDAEYFLCSWFDIDSMPKRRMILSAKEICELMEEYHRQKAGKDEFKGSPAHNKSAIINLMDTFTPEQMIMIVDYLKYLALDNES